MREVLRRIVLVMAAAVGMTATAQLPDLPKAQLFPRPERSEWADMLMTRIDTTRTDTAIVEEIEFDDWGFPVMMTYYRTMPDASYGSPIVFDTYQFLDPLPVERPGHGLLPDADRVYSWLDEMGFNNDLLRQTRQRTAMSDPDIVRYNLSNLPEPPRHFRALVDPETSKIVLSEVKPPKVTADQATDINVDIEKRLWLKTFNASLQFSQAYISPNWYQGGKNNLNMLGNLYYNIKLNERFYKDIMFETTMQYKLGLNNAPGDTIRNYSISEDLFQLTSKFGLRAAQRWFYSITLAFKTQLLNSYNTNSRDLKAAFLSPGELNLGVGMTYNYSNPKKTFTANASISPLSWNMKSCTNKHINETAFGIDPGHKTVHQFGSSAECNMTWKLAYNITYTSRLFAFTDYSYFQGDWEHTVNFSINRYLSTQIYAHMRYDTSAKRLDDSKWHKFQFKEILSFGLSYSFKG